jgi:hypothetical protein
MIEKTETFDFLGGKIKLIPAGVMTADKTDSGQDEPYQASVKIVGISKFPQKIPRAAIEKLLEIFSTEECREFLQALN